MAVGKTGYLDVAVEGAGTNVGKVRAYWQEDYYVEENYSTITITNIKGYVTHRNGTADVKTKFAVDGVTCDSFATKSWDLYVSADGTLRAVDDFKSLVSDPIYHNEDGTKTISLKFILVDLVISSVGFNGDNNNSTTKTIELTNIPRASTIAATDANIESVSQITVNRRSTAYHHSIQYSFGDLVGYLDADGNMVDSAVYFENANIAFTVPNEFYAQIPNDPSGVCTLTISTYSMETGNKIGDDKTCIFTATAERSRCLPEISGSIIDINADTKNLTDVDTKLIRFKSDAEVNVEAKSKNAAIIKSISVDNVYINVPENAASVNESHVIYGIERDTLVLTVTDSRGYTNSVTLGPDDYTFVPYVILSCNMSVSRTDPTSGNAALYLSGTYYDGSFGTVDNELKLYISANGANPIELVHDGSSVVISIADNKYTVNAVISGLHYESTHEITVTARDKLSEATNTDTVNKGIPNFDMGENDVNFNVSTKFTNADFSGATNFNGSANFNSDVNFTNKSNVVKSLLCNGASNGDFNDILDHGIYWMELENCANGPSTSGLGFLEVVNGFADATSGVLQKFTYYDTLAIAIRTYFNDAWTDWDFIADTRTEVVWKNASPTSTFDEQTLEFDLSSYDEVEIYAHTSTSSNDCVIRKCIVSEAGSGTQLSIDVNYTSSSNTQITRLRKVTVSYTGIEFGKAYSKNAGSGGDTASSTSYIIPFLIIGIRRVKVT